MRQLGLNSEFLFGGQSKAPSIGYIGRYRNVKLVTFSSNSDNFIYSVPAFSDDREGLATLIFCTLVGNNVFLSSFGENYTIQIHKQCYVSPTPSPNLESNER